MHVLEAIRTRRSVGKTEPWLPPSARPLVDTAPEDHQHGRPPILDSMTYYCYHAAVSDDAAKSGYTVKELANRAGVTTRTVYYYVSEGLLPPPEGGGPATTYRGEHLARLRLIQRLKEEYLPLAEIRRRLTGLSGAEVEGLLVAPPDPPPGSARAYLARLRDPRAREDAPPRRLAESAPPSDALEAPRVAPSYAAAALPPDVGRGREAAEVIAVEQVDWRRIRIGPDVELHVRRDAPAAARETLARMVEAIRRILE